MLQEHSEEAVKECREDARWEGEEDKEEEEAGEITG